MNSNSINKTTIDNVPDVPHTLYKYRVWSDKYHKTILTENTVYMAPPTSFEDEKECRLDKRYDLMSSTDIYNKYLKFSKEENPNWTRQQHRAHAREWAKKSPMKDKAYVQYKQDEFFTRFDKRIGILSLTANSFNVAMWNKYSDYGNGFCVGFDSMLLFDLFGGGGPVMYFDSLPDIKHNEDHVFAHHKKIFSKEKKWFFEEEYRTWKFYGTDTDSESSNRKIIVPIEAYKEIIFGWNTDTTIQDEIIEICRSNKIQVEFKICALTGDVIKIETIKNKSSH